MKFEAVLEKSSGYFNTLKRNKSIPGSDVLIKISENYPKYNMRWVMTGKGEMLVKDQSKEEFSGANENDTDYARPEISRMIVDSENRIRKDLATMTEGMTHNFEVISKGVMRGLQDQQKILKFIDELDVKRINEATGKLEVFLNQ